jgi:hypothetical protein
MFRNVSFREWRVPPRALGDRMMGRRCRLLAHCCPEPMRRHVRSWPDLASSSQYVREGQRIAELEAEFDALQREALALGAEPSGRLPAVGFTRGEDRPMSAFGGRRHAGAERGVRIWTRSRHRTSQCGALLAHSTGGRSGHPDFRIPVGLALESPTAECLEAPEIRDQRPNHIGLDYFSRLTSSIFSILSIRNP